MTLHKVKVRGVCPDQRIELDGVLIKGVRRVTLNSPFDNVTTVTIEIYSEEVDWPSTGKKEEGG